MSILERQSDYNIIPDIINSFTDEVKLRVFRRMCLARTFNSVMVECIKGGGEAKERIRVNLSTGQESVAAAIIEAVGHYQFCIQHRSADIYLCIGAPPEKLRDELLRLDTGCMRGLAGSDVHYVSDGPNPKIRLYGFTGFTGENIPVGVGMALGNKEKTCVLFGDGGAEMDYALQAYGFAVTHKLPILFICNDNNYSVLSPVQKRRSWKLVDVTKGFGLPSYDVADDPFTIINKIKELENNLPALINVRTNRDFWHVGVGVDGPPEWNRYEIVKKQLRDIGLESEVIKIETDIESEMRGLWKNYL